MAILDRDRKILWARSGNRCSLCKTLIVEAAQGDDVEAIIGDEAHIVAQRPGGARAGSIPVDELDRYANLILLCRNDHAKVDKQEQTFTPDKLRELKASHEGWVESRLASAGTVTWRTRAPEGATTTTPVIRISTGAQLDPMLEGAAMLHFDYDELFSKREEGLVTAIFQSIEDFAGHVASMAVPERIQRQSALSKELADLRVKGFDLYCGRLSYRNDSESAPLVNAASLLVKRRPDPYAIARAMRESDEDESTDAQGFEKPSSLPHDKSDILFGYRLSDAFPGERGLVEITNPVTALDRLDVLFREPLHVQHADTDGHLSRENPLWWFRGGRTLSIDSYKRLGPERCVIGCDELHIKRVVAFRPFIVPSMHDFLYIESRAEPPVGVYEYEDGYIEKHRSEYGYVDEEYAIWNGRPITRLEYDDGAAIIDGRPVKVKGAQVRIRFLTDYNLIVCGNRHVINENSLDRQVVGFLDGILAGTETVQALADFVRSLPKPYRYMGDDWE